MICMAEGGKKKELHEPAKTWRVTLYSLAGSMIIFLITLPARFPEVRRWKTSVLKNNKLRTA